MSDLISRQAAIKDAESWVAIDEHEKQLQKNVIEWLKEFPPAELGTNLAEVGTSAVRGYPIDADALMAKVAEEYGERARDTLYRIIKYMPPAQPKTATVTIGRTKGGVTMWYECDACGEPIDQNDCYCRKCGRKLKHE